MALPNSARRPGDTVSSLTSSAAALVITCEHGGNRVPAPYGYLFRHCRPLLQSHHGFDLGALVMAKAMANHFRVSLLHSPTSRLVVDLNRSMGHRSLHWETIREQPATVRQEIIEHYYQPYRTEAMRLVTQGIALRGRVLHISCHSFTPSLNGVVRHADIGLLYDPARQGERDLCAKWKSALRASIPSLKVRRNYPYQGRNDGLTTSLRRRFPPDTYIGIELELNQKNLLSPPRQWAALRKSIIATFEIAHGRYHP